MNLLDQLLGVFKPSAETAKKRSAHKLSAAAHEEFKTAARDGDVPAIEGLISSGRMSLGDELDHGRGLLQFAVMTNSVKAARYLVGAGADVDKRDTLGASAAKLGRKGSDAMTRALAGAPLPVA